MKKLILGLFVAVIALSASAFTNAETDSKLAPYYYGNAGGGLYVLITGTPNPNLCEEPDPEICILVSNTEEVGEFVLGSPEQPSDIEPFTDTFAKYF